MLSILPTAVYFEQNNFEDCVKACDEAIEVGRKVFADYKLISRCGSIQRSCVLNATLVSNDNLSSFRMHFVGPSTARVTPTRNFRSMPKPSMPKIVPTGAPQPRLPQRPAKGS